MQKYIILILVCLSLGLNGQKEDFTWPLGYNFERDTFFDEIGGMDLSFLDSKPQIKTINRVVSLKTNTSAICDSESGELLFYTNGYYINNKLHERMIGGDSLLPEDDLMEFGDFNSQASIILPLPDKDSNYVLIHRKRHRLMDTVRGGFVSSELYYSIIDLKKDDGLGAVTEFAIPLTSDWLMNGQMTACRHGNGRDWWIYARHWLGQEFYVFLLDPSGVNFHHIESTQVALPAYWGRLEFSPDGTMFGIRSADDNYNDQSINFTVYSFNRCSGYLDTIITSFFDRTLPAGDVGFAFSPNSRFAYLSTIDTLVQYDLHADNVPEAKYNVAVFDSFFDPFFTYFFYPLSAPDNKIYVTPPNAHVWWHTIHAPDSLGAACRAVQHDFKLPRFNFGTNHNFPHFRLGPLDGSACDTLGINNVPGARFRDEGEKKHRWFVDLSYGNPDEWQWTFGDGKTSSERLPVHDYDTSGVYEVCLTVKNEYGEDTWCDSIAVDCITTTADVVSQSLSIGIYPNPSEGVVWLEGEDLEDMEIDVTHLDGRIVPFKRIGQRLEIPVEGVFMVRFTLGEVSTVQKVLVLK